MVFFGGLVVKRGFTPDLARRPSQKRLPKEALASTTLEEFMKLPSEAPSICERILSLPPLESPLDANLVVIQAHMQSIKTA